MITQLSENEWDEIASPVYLCILPLNRFDLESNYGLKFFEYKQDGLGKIDAVIIKLEGSLFWLHAPNGVDDEYSHLTVSCRSFEPDAEEALAKVLSAFSLKKDQLSHVNKDIPGKAKWILTRLDDNGNEIEMFRFLEEISANWLRKKYEDKGHKQAYFVRKET